MQENWQDGDASLQRYSESTITKVIMQTFALDAALWIQGDIIPFRQALNYELACLLAGILRFSVYEQSTSGPADPADNRPLTYLYLGQVIHRK